MGCLCVLCGCRARGGKSPGAEIGAGTGRPACTPPTPPGSPPSTAPASEAAATPSAKRRCVCVRVCVKSGTPQNLSLSNTHTHTHTQVSQHLKRAQAQQQRTNAHSHPPQSPTLMPTHLSVRVLALRDDHLPTALCLCQKLPPRVVRESPAPAPAAAHCLLPAPDHCGAHRDKTSSDVWVNDTIWPP